MSEPKVVRDQARQGKQQKPHNNTRASMLGLAADLPDRRRKPEPPGESSEPGNSESPHRPPAQYETRGSAPIIPKRTPYAYATRSRGPTPVAQSLGERETARSRSTKPGEIDFAKVIREPWSKPLSPNERIIQMAKYGLPEIEPSPGGRPTSQPQKPPKRPRPEPPTSLAGLVDSPQLPHLLNPYALAIYSQITQLSASIQTGRSDYQRLMNYSLNPAQVPGTNHQVILNLITKLRDEESSFAILLQRYHGRRKWWTDFVRNASDPRWQSVRHYDNMIPILFKSKATHDARCAALCLELRQGVSSQAPQSDNLLRSCIAAMFVLEKAHRGTYRLITENLAGLPLADKNATPASGGNLLVTAGHLARLANTYAITFPEPLIVRTAPVMTAQQDRLSLPTETGLPDTSAASIGLNFSPEDPLLGSLHGFSTCLHDVSEPVDPGSSSPLGEAATAIGLLPFSGQEDDYNVSLRDLLEGPSRVSSPHPFFDR